MKKKLSIVAVLVMSVIVTAYSVSGTYAKYIASAEASDTARVAQFYINTASTLDMFAAIYENDYTTKIIGIDDDGDNLIAPGAKGSSKVFTFTGNVETNYTLSSSLEYNLETAGFKLDASDNDSVYIPLVFTIEEESEGQAGKKEYTPIQDGANLNIDQLATKFKTLYDSNVVYAPGDLSKNPAIKNYRISWYWDFEDKDAGKRDAINEKDTTLGNKELIEALGKLTITVKVTATQSNHQVTNTSI